MKTLSPKGPRPAYIFGGLEALLLQGLIGGLLGGLLVVKSYWRRIKAYFTGEAQATMPPPSDKPDPPDESP